MPVQLVTSRFAYGEVPAPDGYIVRELFYRQARGTAGSRARRMSKLVSHVGDMRALRRLAASAADVVHFQWLAMPWLDVGLLPDGPPRLVEYLDGLRSRPHFVPALERTESFFLKRDSA